MGQVNCSVCKRDSEKMDHRILRFTIENNQLFIQNTLDQGTEQHKETSSTNIADKGEKSFALKLGVLTTELKSCLDYCFIIQKKNGIEKEILVRLLVAEGLIQEKPGEIMEDVAKDHIEKLINMGLLHVDFHYTNILKVPYQLYEKLCIQEKNEEDISNFSVNPNHIVRFSAFDDGKNIPPKFYNLPIGSLIMFSDLSKRFEDLLPEAYLRSVFHEVKFLKVLVFENLRIKRLPDELGDLVHLRYLSLSNSSLSELPESIGGLQNLQTLDICNCYGLKEIPNGIMNLGQLRHLIIRAPCGSDYVVRVPNGIAKLVNLYTLTGLYAGGDIASELSNLTQLKQLEIKCFSEDHARDLFNSIMKMDGLLSLSLSANRSYSDEEENSLLPSFESFSPPLLLQQLTLCGVLVEMPKWIGSMENLTSLQLYHSYLWENPTSLIQFLPNLTHLTLFNAYNTKRIGKEFCERGGFLKLEFLYICSDLLVEWSELEDGALPSLKYLNLHCSRLMLLPEGLQYLSNLERLDMYSLHPDLQRRLWSSENYKIQHIRKILTGECPSRYV